MSFYYFVVMFVFEAESHSVTQAGLELSMLPKVGFELTVVLLPQLPGIGIIGVCHYVWLKAFTKEFDF